MTSIASIHLRAGTALAFVLCASASAQTVFPEVEPNSSGAAPQLVSCMAPGDSITGTTTGTVYGATAATVDTYDIFQVKTCALPLAIYRHKFTLTSATLGQNAGQLLFSQTNTTGCGTAAVAGTALYAVGFLTNNEARFDAFGKQEQQYLFLTGVPGTTSPYTMTLSNTVITPTVIGPFQGGAITITTAGQGNATNLDTSFVVYDSNLTRIAGFQNEDECPGSAADLNSTMTRTFTPGTYYLAMGHFPTTTDGLAPNDDRGPTNTHFIPVQLTAFFADELFEGGAAGTINFAVTDAAGTTPLSTTKAFYWDTKWFKFTVATFSPGVTMCVPGTAGVQACACGNPNGAGVGCSNTGSSGGSLSSAGNASLAADATDPGSVTLTGTNMLSGSSCIFLQGDQATAAAGVLFGAGVRCTGGQLFRLKVKGIAAGSATYPVAGDRSISNRSIDLGTPIPAAATRWYQIYYRDPTLANPGGSCPGNATFNITSGQSMVWN